MRIHGRLGNPLLRRVQRHMHVATLFHGPAPEAGDVPGVQPPGEARQVARPVLPAVPAAAGMAAEPGLPDTVLSQPGGERVQMMPAPAAVVPPAPSPAPSPVAVMPAAVMPVTPAAPMPRPVSPAAAPAPAEPPRTEEDRTWKRLQTIMRKHQEKEEAEQAAQSQPEQQPPAAPSPATPALQRSPAPPAASQPAAPPSQVGDERAEAAPLPRRVSVEEFSKTEPVQPVQTSAAERSQPPATVTGTAAEKPAAAQRAVTEGPIQRAEAPLSTTPAPQAAVRPQGLQPPAGPPAQPVSREDAAPAGPAGEAQPERPVVDAQAPTLIQGPRAPVPGPEAAPMPAALRAEPPEEPAPVPLEARTVSTDDTLVQAKPAVRPAAEAHPAAQPPLAKAFVAGAPAGPAEPAVAEPAVAEPADAADKTILQTRAAESIPASPPARLDRSEVAPETPQAVAGAEIAAAGEEPPVSRAFTPASPARVVPPAAPGVPPAPGVPAAEEETAEALPAAPLQAVWPVEHLEGEVVQRQVEPTIADSIRAEPVLPHDDRVGQILQSVAPGLASDSHVELVTPRRPRPSAVRAEKSVEAQPPEPSPGVPSEAALPGEQAVQPAAPVVQRQPVETEIGALPADLWSLIGEAAPASQPTAAAKEAGPSPVEPPAPLPEEAQTMIAAKPPVTPPTVEQPAAAQPAAAHAAVQAPLQSALQRHLDDEAVQRKAAGREPQPAARAKPAPPEPASGSRQSLREAPSGEEYWTIPPEGVLDHEPEMAEDVMQRAIQIDEVTTEVAPAPASGGGEAPDVDELAQKVYSEIKRRLAVEFERFRRR